MWLINEILIGIITLGQTELGIISMKGNSHAPEMEPQHQMQFSDISRRTLPFGYRKMRWKVFFI